MKLINLKEKKKTPSRGRTDVKPKIRRTRDNSFFDTSTREIIREEPTGFFRKANNVIVHFQYFSKDRVRISKDGRFGIYYEVQSDSFKLLYFPRPLESLSRTREQKILEEFEERMKIFTGFSNNQEGMRLLGAKISDIARENIELMNEISRNSVESLSNLMSQKEEDKQENLFEESEKGEEESVQDNLESTNQQRYTNSVASPEYTKEFEIVEVQKVQELSEEKSRENDSENKEGKRIFKLRNLSFGK